MRFLFLLAILPLLHVTSWPAPVPGSDSAGGGDYPASLADESLIDSSKYQRQGDGKDQSRSPCPFLNTAANHGILPYSGKGIKAEWFHRLLLKAGVAEFGAKTLAGAVEKHAQWIKENKDPNHPEGQIDLSDLNIHGQIEHDLSLSRSDILGEPQKPDDWKPDVALISNFLSFTKDFESKAGNDEATMTYATVAGWRRERYNQESKRHKPNYGLKAQFLGSGECSLLLNVLGKDGNISVKDAESFLIKETFPTGWKAHTVPNVQLTVGIARCAAGYYISDGWLKWFGKFELPGVSNAEKAASVWSWAYGNKEACTNCK